MWERAQKKKEKSADCPCRGARGKAEESKIEPCSGREDDEHTKNGLLAPGGTSEKTPIGDKTGSSQGTKEKSVRTSRAHPNETS